jgi:hypothetical protein
MAKQPTRASAALLAGDTAIGGVTVREITLATLAILEEIDSYLFRDGRVRPIDRITTLFVLTRPAAESLVLLRKGGIDGSAGVPPAFSALESAAWAWSETLHPRNWPALNAAVVAAARRVMDVAPSGDDSGDPGDDAGNG